MDNKTTDMLNGNAKNPSGQRHTMASAPVGKPTVNNPELRATEPIVISPTSDMGCKQLEQSGK